MSIPATASKPPPARGWYIVAGLLAVAAVVASSLFVIYRVNGLGARLLQVVVPGETSLILVETGSHTIFHEYNSVVDGKVYSAPSLSGLRVSLVSADGTPVKLVPPTATSRYSFAGREGISVFTFNVLEPGTYRLAASYENGRSEPRTVLTVGSGFVAGIITTVMIAILIAFAGIGAAIAVAVVVYQARRRARLAGAPAS
jgi:hypothetical protein